MQANLIQNLQSQAILQPQNLSAQTEVKSNDRPSFDDLVKESMTSATREEVKDSKNETNQEEVKALKDETVVAKNDESEKDSKKTVKDAEKIDAKKEKIRNKTSGLIKENLAKNIPEKTVHNKENQNEQLKFEKSVSVRKEEKLEQKDVKNSKKNEFEKNQIHEIVELDTKNAEILAANQIKNENQEIDIKQQELESIFVNNEEEEFSVKEKKSEHTFTLDKEGKIIVHDLRTKTEEKIPQEEKKTSLKVTDVKVESKNSAEITMEVASNVQQNVTSSNDQTAASSTSNFQQMLTNQIQQNASDFVKAGNILLKDNDAGSIKLILHPESLGNVKIDLQISDKNITGRIVVASAEAYNAFKDSTDSLKQAFINSGFESAGLDLSFAGQDANSNQFTKREQDNSSQFILRRGYGDVSENAGFEYEENFVEISMRNSVNIVA